MERAGRPFGSAQGRLSPRPAGPFGCAQGRLASATIGGGLGRNSFPMNSPLHDGVAIEFRNVVYRPANGQEIVSGLNLEVRRGETLVLLGRSGSGKTTTLKLINDLVSPSSGQVLVEGRATTEWDPIRLRRGIGYVIQDAGLFPHFTVERNIGLVPSIEKWPAERTRQRVLELLQLVGLEAGMASRYPRELSGGQRQRVGVARALAADPPILLMDEPFGALDPLTRADLQREFLALQKRIHKTVVFVTHDLREAMLLGTRIALMESGQLVTVLPKEEFTRSSEPLVTKYMDAFGSGMNGRRDTT
jgi:osmoprotectant transport system ATP-binding protein